MNTKAKPEPLLPGDEVLSWEEVADLGLEEAPADIGPADDEMEADHD